MSDYEHEHKYFVFKTFETYERCYPEALIGRPSKEGPLYVKVEYAIIGCNCGSVLKKKVES